jgi:rhodanese-related sulfurtransferase
MQDIIVFIQHHLLLNAAFFTVLFALILLEFINQKRNALRVSPAQVTRLINDGRATVVDLRSSAVFNQGHIIGSISIPATDLPTSTKRLEKMKSGPIVLVCATGIESSRVSNTLISKGIDAQVLAGGIQAWSNADMPLTKE